MIVRLLPALALFLLPVHAVALGPEDCDRWIGQLRDEASNTLNAGEEREGLLRRLDEASLQKQGTTIESSMKQLDEFQRKTARLGAAGKFSNVENQRLRNLTEAARRCVAQIGERQGRAQP
jgi:hypothetical protein